MIILTYEHHGFSLMDKNFYMRLIMTIILFLLTFCCEASDNQAPPKIGNFALSSSQQPGTLVGLGENIIDKQETQLSLLSDDRVGIHKHLVDVVPSYLYGITDHLSILINLPYAASFKTGHEKSSGMEDASAQLEYAFYSKSTSRFVDQATVVTNITIPTGSFQKTPPTGAGSPSFLLGATFNRTYVDWLYFGSPGAIFTTAKNGTKFGDSYTYQLGIGRNIEDSNGWIIAWVAELNGTYTQRNRVSGVIDPNSGGNVVYVTPSFWASTKKFIFQFGVGLPATQHLYGNQTRETYTLVANVAWSIY